MSTYVTTPSPFQFQQRSNLFSLKIPALLNDFHNISQRRYPLHNLIKLRVMCVMGPKQIQLQKVDIPFTQIIIALSLKQDNLKNTL